MSKSTSADRAAPKGPMPDVRGDEPVPGGTAMSRRQAIPLIGLGLLAAGSCTLRDDPLAVDPTAQADRIAQELAEARIHRGGIQRFALHHRRDNVAVKIENEPGGEPGTMTVTVYETDPATGAFVRSGGAPRVLEVHHGIRNATIAQIESEYMLFYYLYDN